MQVIKTERLSFNFEEKEILNRTMDMMDTIINQSEDRQLMDYASTIYDNLADMLDTYESEV